MNNKFAKWLKNMQNTQDEEIGCSECLDRISQYVDIELSTGDAARRLPEVSQHLEQCGVCQDEYLVLRELASLDARGDLPAKEELAARLKRPPE